MCVESQLFLAAWHWQKSAAATEMAKWASLPCGTFLPQTPSIDLSCLLIFIASQDSTTALPVSCISYSLSSSPRLSFCSSTPLNSISASHLEVRPLCFSSSYLPPPVCHLPSLSVRCCVPRVSVLCVSDGWPFLVWRLLSPLSLWAVLHVCVFSILSLPSREETVQTILPAVAVSILCLRGWSLVTLHLKISRPLFLAYAAFRQVFDMCFCCVLLLRVIKWGRNNYLQWLT